MFAESGCTKQGRKPCYFRESFLSTCLTNQVQTLTLIRLRGFVVGADKLPNVPDPSVIRQGNTGTCSEATRQVVMAFVSTANVYWLKIKHDFMPE